MKLISQLALACLLFPIQGYSEPVTDSIQPLIAEGDILSVDPFEVKVYQTENGFKFPVAIGSALTVITEGPDSIKLLALTDRGPNASIPKKFKGPNSYIFPDPAFAPGAAVLTIASHGPIPRVISIDSTQINRFKQNSGATFSGIPPEGSAQTAYTGTLQPIPNSSSGIDTEGAAFDKTRKLIWIAEEYLPSILAINPTTWRAVKRLAPGDGLPEVLKERAINRGFEGLANYGRDKIAAILQSRIKTNGSAENFIRLVVIDPDSKFTKTYALPLPPDAIPDEYKIGELSELSNNSLIAVESYEKANQSEVRRLIRLDLSEAEELGERAGALDLNTNFRPIKRQPLLDLALVGWSSGKVEGLAILKDRKTIFLSKDNDFGIETSWSGSKLNPADESNIGAVSFKQENTKFLRIKLKSPIN